MSAPATTQHNSRPKRKRNPPGPHLTAERAHAHYRYDPLTGSLEKKNLSTGTFRLVTLIDKDGYLRTAADGRAYAAHRVIFLLQTGRWPSPTVDHLDHCKTNNRWDNLREASHSENQANRPRKPRAAVAPYVYLVPKSGRYQARPFVAGKRVKLGTYDTPEQAIEAIKRRQAGLLI